MMKKVWSQRTVIVVALVALFAGNSEVRAQKQKQINVSFEEKLLATIPSDYFLGTILFSRDGKRVAYVASKGDKEFVVIEDKKGEEFDYVQDPVFSPDGKQVAYVAKNAGKWFIVIGDKKCEEFDWVGDPVFSPDGKKVAFGARKGAELWWKVLDVE